MNYTRNYTGLACATVSVARNPHGYWWVMQGLNLRPLPCEGYCAAGLPVALRGETAGLRGNATPCRPSDCTQIAPGLLCLRTSLVKIAVVNVLALIDTLSSHEGPSSCVLVPKGSLFLARGKSMRASTENAVGRAFGVLGRCFVVALWGSRLGWPMVPFIGSTPTTVANRATGRHHKASSGPKRHLDASSCPHVVGALHKSDAAHDPSGAALCRDRSEQASKPTMRLAHDKGAWKFECTAHGVWWTARVFRDSNGRPKTRNDCDGRESRGRVLPQL